jgi:hypothetical protein
MRSTLIQTGARLLFQLLLRRAPPIDADPAKFEAFARLATQVMSAGGGVVAYDLPYPKHEFMYYLVTSHEALLHGTPRLDVVEFAPGQQTDYRGEPRAAVFATGDHVWPFFFATLNRDRFSGPLSLRNAAMVVGEGARQRRYYLFSVNRELRDASPFGPGAIYILPRETFQRTDNRTVHFPEWVSDVPVTPLARLDVSPEDFPFHDRIATHPRGEFFPLTWLLYRWRSR